MIKLTNEQFLKRLEDKNISSKYVPLEIYKGGKTKILFKCLICGYEWKTVPQNILRGNGCIPCNKGHDPLTNNEFIQKLKKNNLLDKHFPLEEYIGRKYKILFECRKCGHQWKTTPETILAGHSCPICNVGSNGYLLSHEDFLNKLKEKDIKNCIPLEKYTGIFNKILFKCLDCNNEWLSTPKNILDGSSCQKCKSKVKSKPEKTIENFLEKKNIKFENQYKFPDLKGKFGHHLKFDFLLPEFNLLIEYDGISHFDSNSYFNRKLEKFDHRCDITKENYCTINNKKLLRLAYYDFKDKNGKDLDEFLELFFNEYKGFDSIISINKYRNIKYNYLKNNITNNILEKEA